VAIIDVIMTADRGRRKRITLADVAAESGVSIQTASHVLSGNPTVRLPQTTRDRVIAAAQKVGYRPNRHAQAMRNGKTNLVAVWMPLDRPVLNYLQFLHEIYKCVKGSNLDLMVQGLDRTAALSDTQAAPPSDWPVDGVISLDAGKAIEAFRRDARNDNIPVVVLGYELVSNGDTVGWDLVGAVRTVTQKLIASGARDIAFLSNPTIIEEFPRERRRRGYTEAMNEAGLAPRIIGAAGDRASEVEASLLEQFRSTNDFPDAFVCLTDTYALGAARAALTRGLRIPEDVQIWGHGDFPEAEDFAYPISTIRQPREAIVDQAWKWLHERIDNPGLEPRFVELPMTLVERTSAR